MPEPTLDLLTADGRQLMASVNPTWGEPEVFTERAYQKMAALRDAIVAAARSAPVGELTEREVAGIVREWDREYPPACLIKPETTDAAVLVDFPVVASAVRIAARRCARPSDAVLAEAKRAGWDAARAFANEKWGITQRTEHWDAERDRRWPAPPKPAPSVTEPVQLLVDVAGIAHVTPELAARIVALAAQVAPERAK